TTITEEEEKLMAEIKWGWVSKLKPPTTDTITNQAPNALNTNMNDVILNAPNKDKTFFEVDATIVEVPIVDPIHDVSHAKTELTIAVNTFVCPSSNGIAETEIDEIPDEVQARGHKAVVGMTWVEFKALLVEDFYPKMSSNRRSNSRNDENPHITTIIAQQMQNIIPQIVTQVTNNMNNNKNNDNSANNKNGGNNGCSYKGFLAYNPLDYNGKGVRSPVEAVVGMTWVEFKALLVEEFYPSKKMEKLESEL
nr:reverse transcriptase domain-containing protein [Tanacetum cinerariifolium]